MTRIIYHISLSILTFQFAFASAPSSPSETLYELSNNWSFDPVTGGEELVIAGAFTHNHSLHLSFVKGKTIITHKENNTQREYLLISCEKTLTSGVKTVYQLQIKDLTSGGIHDVIVKQVEDQTIWLGLTSRISSDVFHSPLRILEKTSLQE